jgi:ribosomal protein S21
VTYPRSLDEIPDEEIRAELLRRDALRRKGLCAYCKREKGEEPACRMTREHTAYERPTEKQKVRTEEMMRAKEVLHERLCAAFRVGDNDNLAVFLWYVVEGASAYWADNPSDFGLQSAQPEKEIVFGGWNRVTFTPGGGYQIQRYACTDEFIARYLMIGPNPVGWY